MHRVAVHIQQGFSPHMEKAIFVGYAIQSKGWEFFNPVTKKFLLSDRADFDERVFPGLSTRLPEPPAFPTPPDDLPSTPPSNLVPVEFNDDEDAPSRARTHQQVGDVVGDADGSSSSSSSHTSHNDNPQLPPAPPPAQPPQIPPPAQEPPP